MLAVNAASVMTVSVRSLRSESRVDSLIALSARIQSLFLLAVAGGDDSDGDYDCGRRDEDEDAEMGHDKNECLIVSTALGRLTTSFHETMIQSVWIGWWSQTLAAFTETVPVHESKLTQ